MFTNEVFNLSLNIGVVLGTTTAIRILYKKPNGSRGYWDAQVSGTSLTRQFHKGDITIPGIWIFQAFALVPNPGHEDDEIWGESTSILFSEPI